MKLTYLQKQHFYQHGFVHIPNAIPTVMVDAALRAINHSLGEGIDPAKIQTFRSRSYAPELQREAVITDLLNHTPAFALAESLTGAGTLSPVQSGQIALRFPAMQDPPPPPHGHLDGMYSPHNGVPKGEILNFTMLVGIALSDVQTDYAGNFTVWPGTHHLYETYFRQHGSDALLQGMPNIDLPEPLQLKVKAGDLVLVHYQVAHTAAINVSPHPRYAIYFRLKHHQHDSHKWETMTNIWLDWAGVREIMSDLSGQ